MFCRFAGCNLWSGPRGGPRRPRSAGSATPTSSAPTAPAAARFADRRRARRRAWPRAWPAPADRRPGRAARRLHRRRAAAAARRRSSSTRCTTRGFEVAIETNGTLPVPAGRRLGVREPQGRRRAGRDDGRRAEAGLPPGGRRARALRATSAFAHFFLQPMDGPDRERQHRRGRRATASPTPAGGSACRPTSIWASRDPRPADRRPAGPSRDLQGVQLRGRPPAAQRARRPQVRPAARPLVPGRACTSRARSAPTPAG